MVRNYKKVEFKGHQWFKLFKIINDLGGAISIYDLSEYVDKVRKPTRELMKSLDFLEKQGRIKRCLGKSADGMLCIVIVSNGGSFDEDGLDENFIPTTI